jgi:hypothetical protein
MASADENKEGGGGSGGRRRAKWREKIHKSKQASQASAGVSAANLEKKQSVARGNDMSIVAYRRRKRRCGENQRRRKEIEEKIL